MHLIIQRHQLAVCLGPNHLVAHLAVDGIGKVDGGGAGRQVDEVAARREHKHLVVKEVNLEGAHELLGVRRGGLNLEHLPHPFELAFQRILLGEASFILPVRRNTKLCRAVHLPGADLHLKGDALLADDGGVQRLVHVGLGG